MSLPTLETTPAAIVAMCLTVYWCAVIVLGIKLRRKIGKGPNSIPRDAVSRLMRLFWVTAIVLQILHAWRIAVHFTKGFEWMRPLIVLPWVNPKDGTTALWQPAGWWLGTAYGAAAVCAVCLALTFVCWRKMGKNWRIGIDTGEKTEFISSGPYTLVRHPIYSLRILLDLCAILAVPTPFMAIVTGTDILLLMIEAVREEGYMERKHGEAYAAYKKRVGRFVPRLFVQRGPVV